jgi:DNA-binding transcriptional regulator YhcF (GntR family)
MVKVSFESLIPVYVQIAEAIEADILSGKLAEGGPAYSQLIIARELNVNPATAAKGINALVAKGILEKQRGASMTVAAGALNRLLEERRGKKFQELVKNLVSEAVKMNLSENEVVDEIKKQYRNPEDDY